MAADPQPTGFLSYASPGDARRVRRRRNEVRIAAVLWSIIAMFAAYGVFGIYSLALQR